MGMGKFSGHAQQNVRPVPNEVHVTLEDGAGLSLTPNLGTISIGTTGAATRQANISEEDYFKEKAAANEQIRQLTEQVEQLKTQLAQKPKSSWFDRFMGADETDDPIKEGCKVPVNQVFDALESELEHIARIGHGPKTVGEYLSLIQFYLHKALSDWGCSKKPPLDELDQIRKIGALTVRCMEVHGAPPRVKSKANPIPGQPDEHAPR